MLNQQKQRFDEFTPEQLRRLEAKWKSDMEKELADIRIIVTRLDTAFQKAQGALVFIKWASAATAALAGAAVWISNHFSIK